MAEYLRYPGYGVFAKLPYEIRRQIWLEFLPVRSQDAPSPLENSAKVCLNVLRASHDIHAEVSEVLYRKTRIHFDLSPCEYRDEQRQLWCTVRLNTPCQRPAETGVFRLEHNRSDRKVCRFDKFPFHKVEAVEVSFSAPKCNSHLVWMWRNAVRTMQMFAIPSERPRFTVTVRLRDDGPRWTSRLPPMLPNYSYNLLVLPLANARDLKQMRVEATSPSLEQNMDWREIEWAMGVVSMRNTVDDLAVVFGNEQLSQRVAQHESLLERWLYRFYGREKQTVMAEVRAEMCLRFPAAMISRQSAQKMRGKVPSYDRLVSHSQVTGR
jgi:hypothetical protein